MEKYPTGGTFLSRKWGPQASFHNKSVAEGERRSFRGQEKVDSSHERKKGRGKMGKEKRRSNLARHGVLIKEYQTENRRGGAGEKPCRRGEKR